MHYAYSPCQVPLTIGGAQAGSEPTQGGGWRSSVRSRRLVARISLSRSASTRFGQCFGARQRSAPVVIPSRQPTRLVPFHTNSSADRPRPPIAAEDEIAGASQTLTVAHFDVVSILVVGPKPRLRPFEELCSAPVDQLVTLLVALACDSSRGVQPPPPQEDDDCQRGADEGQDQFDSAEWHVVLGVFCRGGMVDVDWARRVSTAPKYEEGNTEGSSLGSGSAAFQRLFT